MGRGLYFFTWYIPCNHDVNLYFSSWNDSCKAALCMESTFTGRGASWLWIYCLPLIVWRVCAYDAAAKLSRVRRSFARVHAVHGSNSTALASPIVLLMRSFNAKSATPPTLRCIVTFVGVNLDLNQWPIVFPALGSFMYLAIWDGQNTIAACVTYKEA